MFDRARPRVEHAVAHWASAVFVDVIGPYLSAPVHDPPVSGGCLQCEEPLAACAARERLGRRTHGMHDDMIACEGRKPSASFSHIHECSRMHFLLMHAGCAAGLPAQ